MDVIDLVSDSDDEDTAGDPSKIREKIFDGETSHTSSSDNDSESDACDDDSESDAYDDDSESANNCDPVDPRLPLKERSPKAKLHDNKCVRTYIRCIHS